MLLPVVVGWLALATAPSADGEPAPPPPPTAMPSRVWDRRVWRGIVISHDVMFTWATPYAPPFTLLNDRRRIDRLTLAFDQGPLRPLSFELIGVSMATDPTARFRNPTAPLSSTAGVRGFAVAQASVALPGTRMKVMARETAIIQTIRALVRHAKAPARPAFFLTGRF